MLHLLAELGFGAAGIGALGITMAMIAADAEKIMGALGITSTARAPVVTRPVRVRVSTARRYPANAPVATAPHRAAA